MENNKLNVIMITLDGLRRDRVDSCKELSGIAKKSCYFSNMITAAPYTLAAMHALFSGVYPSKNGVNAYYSMFRFRKDACKTLPEYLHGDDYYTFGDFINDSVIPRQGFDEVRIHEENKDDLTKRHKEIIDEVSGKGRKFFLYLHYSNIHTDLIANVGKKFTDMDKAYFENREENTRNYDDSVKRADMYVGEICNHLTQAGLLKNTLLIFTSDHGVSIGERLGEKMYGSFLYDYTLRIFCTFLMPGAPHKEIDFQTRSIDIMPTVLDILHIPVDGSHEPLQGQSLLPFITGKEHEHRLAFSETGGLGGPWPSTHEPNVFALRDGRLKVIFCKTPGTWEIYDLKKDPHERQNLFESDRELAGLLKERLLNFMNANIDSPLSKNIDEVIASFWKMRARKYDKLQWATRSDFLNKFLEVCSLKKDDVALDVGCGTGIITREISPYISSAIGLDISNDMLRHALDHKTGNETFVQGDILKMPFSDNSFDKVTARMIFHHIMSGTQRAMDECFRVLKSGGLMILAEGVPPCREAKGWYSKMFKLKEDRLTFFEEDLIDLMKNAGFKGIKVAEHISRRSSIKNWLENSGIPKERQEQIMQMHQQMPEHIRKPYNAEISRDDVILDMKFLIVTGKK